MSKTEFTRPSALGDLRAEADVEMLGQTFLETADYRTLIETSDRAVVVGRRGTGKSALTRQLNQHWSGANGTVVITITPEEHQTIGLRPKMALFGDSFRKIRAGSRLAWRYGLMMEAAFALSSLYKFSQTDGYRYLKSRVEQWVSGGTNVLDRYSAMLRQVVDLNYSPEERIADLSLSLDLSRVTDELFSACAVSDYTAVILIDRLDEGYEPDDSGTGLVDGLVQAAIDLKTRIPGIKPVIFLRDNIFRSVQALDPDYSRNIEGHVLRLHWDAESLFIFATKRLRVAFDINQEASLKIWNSCTGGELKGRSGFNKCLQLTLYRPRDLLSLFNQAFYMAGKNQQSEIMLEHIENTGQSISQIRLDDLRKEYQEILPGLDRYVAAFQGCNPELTVLEAQQLLENVLSQGSDNPVVQQDFFIFEDGKAVLRGLYSIGFIGVRAGVTGSFVFCHDGRAPDREIASSGVVLIHPCYWMALNCTRSTLKPDEAEEIHDEYDIEVSSETPAIRNSKITELIARLKGIEEGQSGSTEFENWCHLAIRICFAKGLINLELKPNKQAKSRRDIVGTNLGDGDAWRRIYEDYGTRQVTFEIKNYQGLEAADYYQIQSYLTGDYGRLAFVVTRESSTDLYANKDIEWVQEMYSKHQVVIIKLTATFLVKLLHKLRNPQKHDEVDNAIHRLLDDYTRLYLAGQSKSVAARARSLKRKRTKKGRRARST